MTDRRIIWLALGCIIFAAAVVAEVQNGGDLTAVVNEKPARAVPTVRPPPSRPVPPETLAATALARPLFSPTRRPPSSDGPASAEPANKRLAGIVVSPQQRLAIFAVPGARPLVLKEGPDRCVCRRAQAANPFCRAPGAGGANRRRRRRHAQLFADTDIGEVAHVILGNMLRVDYTVDPRVHGMATLATATPLPRSALPPTLETLLNQNGATQVRRSGLYEVVPLTGAAVSNAVPNAAGNGGGGSQVIALRYASASDLAKVLQPYIAEGGKITPDPAHNALTRPATGRPARPCLA